MAFKGQAFKTGAAPRLTRRAARAPVAVHATKQEASVMERLAPALLAGVVAFTGVSATYAPIARADDEEFMSPYQKRQAEMERRRELLREARERAAARASGVEVEEPAAAPAAPATPAPAKPSTDFSAQAARLKKESLKAYEDAAKNRPAPPVTAEPEEAPAPAVPRFGGFSFGKSSEAPAPAAPVPAPAPAAPAPAARPVVPVPVPVPAPALVKEVEQKKPEPKKAEAPKAQPVSKKRRGPLPLWFAEILVLGAYVGLGLAATKYSEQTGKLLGGVWSKVVELYSAAEKFIGSRTQPSA